MRDIRPQVADQAVPFIGILDRVRCLLAFAAMAGKVHDTTGRFGGLADFGDEPPTQITKRVTGFRPRASRAHMLKQVEGPGVNTLRFILDKQIHTLGRAATNDIHLENDNVSRAHARLTRIDDEYTLEDLDSRNGILLNGLAVHSAVLRDGDELHIGDFVFSYQEGA
jgi:pSer/pThr/pTyr-binding forkhead associated (FHA) protein